ncbi:lasso peptide biosynthesis B2 protein [Rhodanobacter sp. DHB23]|uniref:lasso peptide biosynthesis B2 protein n=1 Tax=Rhodanobacter sp. DHB23 TaxID=2775923 RepID=UPI001783082C|nr:lasso peptide biosynthesis B2 protein [Rhodanobacter sp. DHB23]MBD8873373.1 lasso peptide biosynthesis B2 protein [Rhodanobacter sp. DHB23]
MQYQLRDGLSFCIVDDHPVFLDTSGDRYFMLPEALESAFTAYIEGRDASTSSLRTLLGHRILLPEGHPDRRCETSSAEPVTRSAMEDQTQGDGVSARTYLEILAIVCRVRSRLRRKNLHALLSDLAAHRRGKAGCTAAASGKSIEENLVAAANQFRHARKWVPLGTTCLLDSLSLVTYLANHQLPADLVFGVALSPFSAHCWVQFRHIVLNETVTGATAHTPILVW